MIFALLVVLIDGLVTVPPSHWTAVRVNVPEQNTTVHCSFEVQTKEAKVQAMLMSRSQAERFNRGRNVNPLNPSGFERSGRFRYRVAEAGEYVLLLDNRLEGRRPVPVSLRIELTSPGVAGIREVSPERRRAIIALSLLFFGAVVVFSARQFLKNAA